jgi:hypothetical protein
VVGQAQAVEVTTVPVIGQRLLRALRLRTRTGQQFPNIYAVQVQATPTGSVKQGDVLLATFYVRGIEGGQAETGETQTQFVFERATDPHTKSAEQNVAIPRGGEWKRIWVPFRAAEDGRRAAPRSVFASAIRPGHRDRRPEPGQLWHVRRAERLPRTPATYAGREPNALWRKEALARIEKIRKADLVVRVVDRNNRPVRNATVAVRMKRHAFPFGSAVAADACSELARTTINIANWCPNCSTGS